MLQRRLGSPSRGGSAEERCCALVEGALLLFNPCWDAVPVLAAVPNLGSPGCCRDSDTVRAHCCLSGVGTHPVQQPGEPLRAQPCIPGISASLCWGFPGSSAKPWVFFLKMVVPEVKPFHQCSTINLKTKPLKTEEFSCKEKLRNSITEHHAQERSCSETCSENPCGWRAPVTRCHRVQGWHCDSQPLSAALTLALAPGRSLCPALELHSSSATTALVPGRDTPLLVPCSGHSPQLWSPQRAGGAGGGPGFPQPPVPPPCKALSGPGAPETTSNAGQAVPS